jgi:hypothetical protein
MNELFWFGGMLAINVFAVLRNRHFVDAGLSARLRHRAVFFNQVRNAGNHPTKFLVVHIAFGYLLSRSCTTAIMFPRCTRQKCRCCSPLYRRQIASSIAALMSLNINIYPTEIQPITQ